MPSKEPGTSDARSVASQRLPTFGAAASIGQASRFYRSPMAYVSTGHAVAASQWADNSASDAEAEGSEMADDDGEAAEAVDASEGMDGSHAEDATSVTDDAGADADGDDDSGNGGEEDTAGDERA